MGRVNGGRYMYAWEYRVRPERAAEFERAYGAGGDWVRLFRGAPGYLGTELHRDRGDPLRYLSLDYWESEQAWRAFREARAAEFERIDAACEALTLEEREIGRFEPLLGR